MTTTETGTDLGELRRRVRAAQHARSFPLLVIGALLVNYGAGNFSSHPVDFRYGAPLAFVAVWALLKVNESRVGVGTGRSDYLVAAALVFAGVNVVLLRPIDNNIRNFFVVQGLWTLIVAAGLLGVAVAARDRLLLAGGLLVAAAGALTLVVSDRWQSDPTVGLGFVPAQPWVDVVTALVGVVLVIGGLVAYRAERAAE